MPMTCTGGRARWRKPYATARFTMAATLFQSNPYCRAVPFQLSSRAKIATAFDSAEVTHAVHLPTPLPAHPTTQQPAPESVDVDHHILLGLLHFRHGMGLQSQLLSDKSLYQHLDPLLSGLSL